MGRSHIYFNEIIYIERRKIVLWLAPHNEFHALLHENMCGNHGYMWLSNGIDHLCDVTFVQYIILR